MFIYKLISTMLIFISLGIQFSTVFQFFSISNSRWGAKEKVLLKYRKETNIVCFSYIIGCVYLNKNMSDLWSL